MQLEQPDLEDEDSSPEWERIKNFVGGANKKAKHPLVQEMERMKRQQPEHFDEGGSPGMTLEPDPNQNDIFQGQSPLSTALPPPQIVPRGTIPSPQPMPSASPPVSAPPAASPAAPSYDAQATNALGGITPEKIAELMQSLNQQSKKGQIGAGIAGIGDAISSISGRNTNHMQNAEDLLQKNKELALKVPSEMAAVGKERFGLSQQLQSQDPASPFSKVTQNANRQLLKSMGAKDSDISSMPASAINDVVGHQVTLQDALARIQQEGSYQKGMLENTRTGLANTAQNEKSQRVSQATKQLYDMGVIGQKLHPDIATNLKKIIDEDSGTQQPGGDFNAQHQSMAPGTQYTAPDGTIRTKR